MRVPETVIRVDEPKPMPQAPKPANTAAPKPAATNRLRRADSVSLKMEAIPKEQPLATNEQALPLTQESLQTLWNEMLTAMKEPEPKLYDHLKDKEVKLEGEDMFVIIVGNNYTESEVKGKLLRILTYLRRRSGRQMLNCRIEVVVEEKDSRPYTARDKYDAMVGVNPTLEMMRVLFPDVDM